VNCISRVGEIGVRGASECEWECEGENSDDEGGECCEEVGACQKGGAGVGLNLSVAFSSKFEMCVCDFTGWGRRGLQMVSPRVGCMRDSRLW
jgi:hypothetical protein